MRIRQLICKAACYSLTSFCHLQEDFDVAEFLSEWVTFLIITLVHSCLTHTHSCLEHWQYVVLAGTATWKVTAHSLQEYRITGQEIHFPSALYDLKLSLTSFLAIATNIIVLAIHGLLYVMIIFSFALRFEITQVNVKTEACSNLKDERSL